MRTRFSKNNRKSQPISRAIEALESRQLLTTTLYIDYGDRFPSGVLNTTVGEVDNTTSGTNPNIDGPRLSGPSGNYADAVTCVITGVNALYTASAAASLRATMTALTQRFYQGLDITVVELTSSFQTVNGHSVRAAADLNEVSQTLGVNEGDTKNNDAYVIVGKYILNGSFNPALSLYGGISTGTDISANNNNDGTACVCLIGSGDSAIFNGNQIAHEAGHTLGLAHVYRQDTGNSPPAISNTTATGAQYDRLHQSEIMSYLGYTSLGGYSVFDRFPMMKGDGNTNANTLEAVGSPSPFEQMLNDPNIGGSALTYVTGTGENDIITITKATATTATVSVQPFDDSAHTITVDAPGPTGNVYSYTIATTQPILVDAGGRDDLIRVVGDLGVTLTVRGMQGNDTLEVDAQSATNATYTPGSAPTTGVDGNPDYRGVVTFGATTINFQEFESTSTVRVLNAANLTETTPLAADTLTYTSASGDGKVSGTSGGVTIVPLLFNSVSNFILDAAVNATAGSIDTISVSPASVTGLTTSTVKTGSGADTITFNGASVTALVTVDSGGGDDALNISNAGTANPIYLAGAGTNSATVSSGAWTVTADLGASAQVVSVTVNGGSVTFNGTQHLAGLTLANGTNVTVGQQGSRVLVTKALSVGSTAKLDLKDNEMVLDYTGSSPAVGTIRPLLLTGYNAGAWNGNGITSSTATAANGRAVGFKESGAAGVFAGETVDATAILFKYVVNGDANLSGQVEISDLGLLAANWQGTGKIFGQGDFDYNGTVDISDLGILASHWQQSQSFTGAVQSTSIPPRALKSLNLASDASVLDSQRNSPIV